MHADVRCKNCGVEYLEICKFPDTCHYCGGAEFQIVSMDEYPELEKEENNEDDTE